MKKIIYTLFALFLLSSCGEKEGLYGEFTPSLSKYTFGVEGGSVTITVEPKDFIWDLAAGRATQCGSVEWPASFNSWEEWSEWSFQEITEIPRPGSEEFYIIVRIKTDWFEITRDPLYQITLDVQPNTSGRERQVLIYFHSHWRAGATFITQAAE
jgi:hypothetical protein